MRNIIVLMLQKLFYILIFIIVITTFVNALKVQYITSIQGTSMLPNITQGKLLIIENFDIKKDNLTINGIYSYKPDYNKFPSQYTWIMHRLKGIYANGTMCLFKGDNNNHFDPLVPCKNINHRFVRMK